MFLGPKTSYMEANIQKDEEMSIFAPYNTHMHPEHESMRLRHGFLQSHVPSLWSCAPRAWGKRARTEFYYFLVEKLGFLAQLQV